jgi:predicted nuclease of restriction endonuclease-like (RecB) superfamily
LEEGLLQRLTDFLLELGDDFAFVGRQRRLRIDDTWFRIDLVFFHWRLRCLVIIDLLCCLPQKTSRWANSVMRMLARCTST